MTTLRLSQRKNEKCELKKCQSSVKINNNKKTSSNEKFIDEVH
jgi:hypothetical protein